MSKFIFVLFLSVASLFVQTVAGQNDFKIKQRMTMAGQSFESTVMIKGSRQRSETNMMGMQNVSIIQCDLKRTVDISDLEKKYVVTPMDTPLPNEPARRVSTITTRQPAEKGGVVTQTIEMIDTGERKQLFGMTARHIKTIMTMDPSPDACQKDKQRIETDGWYVDLSYGLTCQTDRPVASPPSMNDRGGCRDRMNIVRKGTAKLGFPLLLTTKIGTGSSDGDGTVSTTTEVLELSKAALSADLFDVPAGYTEASSRQELYGMATQRAMMQRAKEGAMEDLPDVRAAQNTVAKRPGVIRVGVLPVTNSTPRDLSLDMYRNQLVSSLTVGSVQAVPISSEADAKRMECDYLLTTNVKIIKQSASSKVGGLFGKVTGAATGGLAKVESTIAYMLRSVNGGSTVLSSEATAKVEGDDASVSATLETEVQAVLKSVKK